MSDNDYTIRFDNDDRIRVGHPPKTVAGYGLFSRYSRFFGAGPGAARPDLTKFILSRAEARRKLRAEAQAPPAVVRPSEPIRQPRQRLMRPRSPLSWVDERGRVYGDVPFVGWRPQTSIGGAQVTDTTIGGIPRRPGVVGQPARTTPGTPVVGSGGQSLFTRRPGICGGGSWSPGGSG